MRTFKLNRIKDHSNVSGVGIIAEGVEFSDGRCAIRFLTSTRSTAVYDSMTDLVAIHGHGGDTQVVYDDILFLPKPDWSEAPKWANWWAVDADGDVFFYKDEPVQRLDYWTVGAMGRYDHAGTVQLAWKDSKQQRPQETNEDPYSQDLA